VKEKLFRLEIRHQAGTISEEEYSRERAKAEQILRDLVRAEQWPPRQSAKSVCNLKK